MQVLRVRDRIGSPLAVSVDDGERLLEGILPRLRSDESFTLDFSGVSVLTSAFLNAAIGQLYGQHDAETIDRMVHIVGLEAQDENLYRRVQRVAREYYADPEAYEEASALDLA